MFIDRAVMAFPGARGGCGPKGPKASGMENGEGHGWGRFLKTRSGKLEIIKQSDSVSRGRQIQEMLRRFKADIVESGSCAILQDHAVRSTFARRETHRPLRYSGCKHPPTKAGRHERRRQLRLYAGSPIA